MKTCDEKGSGIGLVFTEKSPSSCQGLLFSSYFGGILTRTLPKCPIYLFPIPSSSASASSSSDSFRLPKDYVIHTRSGHFLHHPITPTTDYSLLKTCQLIIYSCDSCHETAPAFLQKQQIKPSVVFFQLLPSGRRANELQHHFPKNTIIHTHAGFRIGVQSVQQATHLVTTTNGSLVCERLAKEKAHAVHYVDLLEKTGIQVLSRKNLPMIQCGFSILHSFEAVCALTGLTPSQMLRNGKCRLILASLLEDVEVVVDVVQNSMDTKTRWTPDTSSTSCLFSIWMIYRLLPLPNGIFNNVILPLCDFGIIPFNDSVICSMQLDRRHQLATTFQDQFADFRQVAEACRVNLKGYDILEKELGQPDIRSVEYLYQLIQPSRECRVACRNFLLQVIGISILASYLFFAYFIPIFV